MWQPIETYKEGMAIFYYPKVKSGKYDLPEMLRIDNDLLLVRKPTHWMEAPPPPENNL